MEINLKTLSLAVVISLFGSSATGADDLASLGASSGWRTLLHFRSLGASTSEIDEPGFFLSPEGRRDSVAELGATIAAFRQPASFRMGRYDQHPRCAYPARLRFLLDHGFAHEFSATEVECADLKNWKRGLGVDSVAIVYAAPYLGNPASMFGHTFLRLKSTSHPLTDASVSFDATPTSDGGLVFALKGLSGGYRGLFSQQPYYTKIKTYSEIEDRSLWEYDLNLTQVQIEQLVDHLWEMGSASIDYFFFDENCSYQLLSLLEVAQPMWRLRERFSLMTIPLDTIREIESYHGSVRATTHREALITTVENRIGALTSEERREFESVQDLRRLSGRESVGTLDSLLEWQKYQLANRADGGRAFKSQLESEILFARARAVGPSQNADEVRTIGQLPESGHLSSKLAVGWFIAHETAGATLSLRPVLHDRMDSDLGYVRNSTLIIGRVSFVYFPVVGVVALDDVTFAEVENLRPIDKFHSALSWVAGARIVRPADLDCLDCVAGQLQFGLGPSTSLFSGRTLISALANARIELSNSFHHDYSQLVRLNPSVRVSALTTTGQNFKFELVGEYFQPLSGFARASRAFTETGAELSAAVPSASGEIRARFLLRENGVGSSQETRFAFARYF